MKTLLVGYDLNQPDQDYADLIEKLKSFGTWWHHLDSTWLIRAELTAKEMRDILKPLIGSSDEVLVIEVTGCSAAWMGFNQKASDWIKEHL